MKIVLKDVYKSFGALKVLQGVSLEIAPGKITVILGGSGTGKSVLLKHIIGLIRPDKGSIKIDDVEITKLRERQLLPIRARFGMIFQEGALLASLPVGENVALGLVENGKASRGKGEQVAKEKLKLVGLDGKFDAMPDDLSGGMRKRAAIARALTMEPECILYDEPTAGLDPPRSRQIEDLIKQVGEPENMTSVVVTHDMDCVKHVAEHIFMLHEGKIIFSGTSEELWASDNPVVRDFIQR